MGLSAPTSKCVMVFPSFVVIFCLSAGVLPFPRAPFYRQAVAKRALGEGPASGFQAKSKAVEKHCVLLL